MNEGLLTQSPPNTGGSDFKKMGFCQPEEDGESPVEHLCLSLPYPRGGLESWGKLGSVLTASRAQHPWRLSVG